MRANVRTKPSGTATLSKLKARLDDLEDAFALMQAQRNGPSADAWPDALVQRMLASESLLRLWREHRGLTLESLSQQTGVAKGYLSEIESGKKPGSVATLKKCAEVLLIDLDDLVS